MQKWERYWFFSYNCQQEHEKVHYPKCRHIPLKDHCVGFTVHCADCNKVNVLPPPFQVWKAVFDLSILGYYRNMPVQHGWLEDASISGNENDLVMSIEYPLKLINVGWKWDTICSRHCQSHTLTSFWSDPSYLCNDLNNYKSYAISHSQLLLFVIFTVKDFEGGVFSL